MSDNQRESSNKEGMSATDTQVATPQPPSEVADPDESTKKPEVSAEESKLVEFVPVARPSAAQTPPPPVPTSSQVMDGKTGSEVRPAPPPPRQAEEGSPREQPDLSPEDEQSRAEAAGEVEEIEVGTEEGIEGQEASMPGISPEPVPDNGTAEPLPDIGTAELTAILDHEEALRQLQDLQVDLQRARRDLAEAKELALRKAADLENFRRRAQRQLDDVVRYGAEKVLKEILPIIDDLERAVAHGTNAGEKEAPSGEEPHRLTSFFDGMVLVLRKFQQTLERLGVRGFDSVGQPFNPQLHEALSQVETTEHPGGTVVSEYLRGYLLHDRLMRPALVIVARTPTPIEPPQVVAGQEPATETGTDQTPVADQSACQSEPPTETKEPQPDAPEKEDEPGE